MGTRPFEQEDGGCHPTTPMTSPLVRLDPGRGLDFLSFAVPTITGEIRRRFGDHTWPRCVPRRHKDIQVEMNIAIGPLTLELGRAPRPSCATS